MNKPLNNAIELLMEADRLHEGGMIWRDVADKLGVVDFVSLNKRVHRWKQQTGQIKKPAPQNNRKWSDEDSEKCKRYALDGLSLMELAQKMGRTQESIRKRMNKVGIYISRPVDPAQERKLSPVEASTLHLVDLMRAFNAHNLGDGKAKYRMLCERRADA